MLNITLKRGDVLHVVFSDGTNGIIKASGRCEFDIHFPRSIKITRESGTFTNTPNLIKRNQK
ncbi:hypothetical protein AH714_08590 [Salmonella enterica]|nr:hypothetical protein [Salmonella enterica]